MDDTLENPRQRTENISEGDENSSGDEDGGLDWTKLPQSGAAARPIIPKRGEKDFEPAPGGGSGLQLHVLDRSRAAMFDALRADRTISSKTISYGIWYPSIDRVHVTTARGIHFSTMGHSVSRTVEYDDPDDRSISRSSKPSKRLELLPEEALYLVERGALFCYKSISDGTQPLDPLHFETKSPGTPMSVQQAFAEMIGREGMTLERYQVYAYLRRLGFVLMRAEPPAPGYPVPPPVLPAATGPQTVIHRLTGLLWHLVSSITNVARVFHRPDWWRPIQLHRRKTAQDIFKALRFIPCGHSIPLHQPAPKPEHSLKSCTTPSPYSVFFHAYKPSTPFRKTAPPPPDFYVVVVNARTTPIPSLQELTRLFGTLPVMPLPPPRKRGTAGPTKQPSDSRSADVRPVISAPAPQGGLSHETTPAPGWSSAIWAFFQWLFSSLLSFRSVPPPPTKLTFTPPKPNPFLALKTGKKTVVIAAVDAGNISFFRFGQGVFEEWLMI